MTKPAALLLLFGIGLMCLSMPIEASEAPADDKNILYTGRIDHTDPKAPILWWPGSQVTARFNGASIRAKLHDYGDNYFYAIIDGGAPMLIDLKPGLAEYTIAAGLRDTEHTITLFKRTETAEGRTAFHGFVLEHGKSLLRPPARPARRIEFYGDSITTGHSVASNRGDSNEAADKDSYYAYPSIVARALDAEFHCIAVTGIGLYVDTWAFGGNMQTMYYDRLTPSKPWNFGKWIPNVVVINLGQNDAWGPHTPDGVTSNYVKFVRTLRKHYPNSYIILALGSMQATEEGSPWPKYVHAAAEELRNEHNDTRIFELIFPYSGDPHPTAERQLAMASQLAEFISKEIPGFQD